MIVEIYYKPGDYEDRTKAYVLAGVIESRSGVRATVQPVRDRQ
ncbi:Uncharacterised protein [Mycobacteroides abscessus subsp. massiliense]|nr:Uncharacterised protein [Mycobacteroides abscessus subsp. massiliense]